MATLKLTPAQYAELDIRAKQPLMHAAPIFFGPQPALATPASIHNGTVTLARVNGRQLGITNSHVIKEFRECAKSGDKQVCFLGNVEIDLETRVIDDSAWYDIATLDLSDINPMAIRGGNEIPCQFFDPSAWPPKPPKQGEFLMFGGSPLSRRRHHAMNVIEFGSVSSGASEIHSVQEDVITAQIQIDECVIAFDDGGDGFLDLPGISGGPAMQLRAGAFGIEVFELIGVVFEHKEAYDTLRVRPLHLVDEAGHIQKPTLTYTVVTAPTPEN